MTEIYIIIVAIIAGLSTYIISCILNKGPVLASAVVTLISGLFFSIFFKEIGGLLAGVGACASYAGMIESKRVGSILNMAFVSILTGIIFIIVNSAYVGIGGRLGTIGAVACFVWLGIRSVIYKILKK